MSAENSWESMIRKKIAQAPEYADAVRTVDARRQRSLLEKIIGKRVLDVAQVTDLNGDAVFLIFYGAKPQAAEEERCIACAWLVEQRRQAVRFEEVTHRRSLYFLPDGTTLAEAIMTGGYAI